MTSFDTSVKINVRKISFSFNEKLNVGGDCLAVTLSEQLKHRFAQSRGILRSSELYSFGLNSREIKTLLEDGQLVRLKEGYYAWQKMMAEMPDQLIAVSTIPNATLHFITAAAIYELTTVIPDTIHLAVPNKGRMPQKPVFPPVELTAYKPALFEMGRATIDIDSISYPIYDRERTVCDCFKRKAEIGDDVGLEVLKLYMRGKKDIQRLLSYAQALHIQQKLQPYVEALL